VPIGSVNWIEQGMLPAKAETHPDDWRFALRNQFFHGTHPLGWIRRIGVAVGGAWLADDEFTFELRGQQLTPAQLPSIVDIWWHPREIAWIRIAGSPPNTPTASIRVQLHLSTFFFTPVVDLEDRYPTMTADLAAELAIEPKGRIA
jgi:hypothetical protein